MTTSAPGQSLTVAEALPRDVGRGLARLDPQDMASLGLQTGDIVRLRGKRVTAARVMPAPADDRRLGAVHIDGLTRENAQVSLGETIGVERATFELATHLTLTKLTGSLDAQHLEDRSLARALEGLPLSVGDRVRATLFGNRYLEFVVREVRPEGIAIVGPRTALAVREDRAAGPGDGGITYEDIGALRREISRIREMIELPLKYPQVFERLGIDAPKGVLLHGPPGCGKTLIARAVANETAAAFFHVSGPEIIHAHYGESEAHLRNIFEDATKRAPSIVFFDEIDAIAGKREDARGDQQVERRVVAQLLSLMDGLKSRGQVVVIGATNLPDVLDQAVRRPGRFDREIVISVPDRHGRLEILEIHTRGMPTGGDLDLARLAEITHGFVGADLEALCREAALAALRRILPHIQAGDGTLPASLLDELRITHDDFVEALKDVEPSAIREVFTEIPDVGWEAVGGLDAVKRTLMETIEWPFKHPELFKLAGTRPPRGILLSGPPGTGKTLLAKAVANRSGVNFISIKGPALLSKWVGDSERALRDVFRKAKQASPCLLFFDEIDAIAPARGGGDHTAVTDRVIGQFLTELDGIEDLNGVTVLAATNRPDIVDPALLRTGRFDIQLALPVPDAAARRDILAIHTAGKPLAPDVDLADLASRTAGYVGSDLEALARRATMLAIRDFVDAGHDGEAPDANRFAVARVHFERALAERPAAG